MEISIMLILLAMQLHVAVTQQPKPLVLDTVCCR